jgi:hypothetical protein
MAERTGQGGGRTIRGYIRHKNGLYYKPGRPNIFYKKVGQTFKPVSQGTLRMKPGAVAANTAAQRPTTSPQPITGAVKSNLRILRDALNDQLSGRLMNKKGKAPTGGFRQGAAGLIAQAITENVLNPLVEKGTKNLISRYRRTTEDKAFPDAEGRLRRPDGSVMYAGPSIGDKYRKPPTTSAPNTGGDSERNIVSGGAAPKAPPVRDSLKVRIEKEYDVLRDEFNNNEIGAVEFKSRLGGLHGSSRMG